MSDVPETVDAYIASQLQEIQPLMHQMRAAIQVAAPMATEKISWGMATYAYYGNLVHFSAQKKHMGFHPAPSGIEAFREELTGYSCSKGTIRFPYEKPLPIALIQKIVCFRVREQEQLQKEKAAAKTRRG